MNVNLILRGVELNRTEVEALTRKADFAFDRFPGTLERIDLVLEDINGPRGGDDKVCRLILHLVGEPVMILQERGSAAVVTGMAALERAAHSLSRRAAKAAVR